MPPMMAMRALTRRLSNVVFARVLADQKRREAGPGGQPGRLLTPAPPALTPHTGSSDKPHPGPATPQPKPLPSSGLDIKGCHERAFSARPAVHKVLACTSTVNPSRGYPARVARSVAHIKNHQ